MEIRAIRDSDTPSFWECLDSVARERKYLAMLEAPSPDRVSEAVKRSIAIGDIRLVALVSSTVVGWCDITRHRREGMDHVGDLGMGVRFDYRRRGIGRALLRQALAETRRSGFEKLELDVFASNTAARALYEQLGFVIEGRRVKSRILDGRYDDIIQMGLLLDPMHQDP